MYVACSYMEYSAIHSAMTLTLRLTISFLSRLIAPHLFPLTLPPLVHTVWANAPTHLFPRLHKCGEIPACQK